MLRCSFCAAAISTVSFGHGPTASASASLSRRRCQRGSRFLYCVKQSDAVTEHIHLHSQPNRCSNAMSLCSQLCWQGKNSCTIAMMVGHCVAPAQSSTDLAARLSATLLDHFPTSAAEAQRPFATSFAGKGKTPVPWRRWSDVALKASFTSCSHGPIGPRHRCSMLLLFWPRICDPRLRTLATSSAPRPRPESLRPSAISITSTASLPSHSTCISCAA